MLGLVHATLSISLSLFLSLSISFSLSPYGSHFFLSDFVPDFPLFASWYHQPLASCSHSAAVQQFSSQRSLRVF
uniref:Putative secreted peptide n=1 Tax=Anopheles braziliensis TaxID=58242 RepID=A0A2M3ZV30_9DIPT